MMLIKFRNLEKSEMAKQIVQDRIDGMVEKFPDLALCKIQVTLEMENSPNQAGPDLFKAKFHVASGRYKGIVVEKANSNLYIALAQLVDHMLESLNRFGDKARVRERKSARQMVRDLVNDSTTNELILQ